MGNPATDGNIPSLDGAQREAGEVAMLLSGHGFSVEDRYTQRASLTYSTGSHNFKTGFQTEEMNTNTYFRANGNMDWGPVGEFAPMMTSRVRASSIDRTPEVVPKPLVPSLSLPVTR